MFNDDRDPSVKLGVEGAVTPAKRAYSGEDAPVSPIDWNSIQDSKDLEVWNRLTSNFWLPEKIPLSSDIKTWNSMTESEQLATIRVLTGLTMLDTVQGSVGAVELIKDARTPHEESVYGNIVFMEAFGAGTQLLTNGGWKNIEDVEDGEKVAQYHPNINSLEFADSTLVEPHFSDEVYEISDSNGDFKQVVSGGHRVYVEEYDGKFWEKAVYEARELVGMDLSPDKIRLRGTVNKVFPTDIGSIGIISAAIRFAEISEVKGEDSDDENRLAGRIFAFPEYDDFRTKELGQLLSEYGVTFTINEGRIVATVSNWDEDFQNEFYPQDISEFSETSAAAFVEEMNYWSNQHTINHFYYQARDVSDKDFITGLSALSGRTFTVNETGDDIKVTIGAAKSVSDSELLVKRVDSQMVYCVQVPSTYLVTKNGESAVISGNCVHAKSYSSIFQTLCNSEQIRDAMRWSKENFFLQKKSQTILANYVEDDPEKKKIASTLLESFLFYSGFYLPLYWATRQKLTNTADIIRLIIADEAIHGYYIGYKYQKAVEEASPERREELEGFTYSLLMELYDNELEYTESIYDDLGLTEDVKKFLRYNANKALNNLGYPHLFEADEATPSAAILSSLNPGGDENHDFFSGSGSSYVVGKAEDTDEDDWDW